MTPVRSEGAGVRPVGEDHTAEAPPYPETEENIGAEEERGAPTGKRGWMPTLVGILVIAVAIALIGLMVFLHLNGTVGPGTH